jgi:hypothetical protein
LKNSGLRISFISRTHDYLSFHEHDYDMDIHTTSVCPPAAAWCKAVYLNRTGPHSRSISTRTPFSSRTRAASVWPTILASSNSVVLFAWCFVRCCPLVNHSWTRSCAACCVASSSGVSGLAISSGNGFPVSMNSQGQGQWVRAMGKGKGKGKRKGQGSGSG